MVSLGSLYFSEIMHFVPCALYWYQRIFMFPLAIILGVAVFKDGISAYRYALPLSIMDMFISGYHTMIQKVPYFQEFEMCTSGVPCSTDYINWLGFITIPILALVAFSIITVSLFILLFKKDSLSN
ncbi:disulfide oxidoreductase [Bacillus sp. ISL-78]|uniref:disulfide oxidoreductase n=1 Tax=Bacillus sp. ISL-78 TaxID=2819139 RepID=UPI002889DBE7|nr:disulfide oxidoreductase [Bacillus sp. ISL-78]